MSTDFFDLNSMVLDMAFLDLSMMERAKIVGEKAPIILSIPYYFSESKPDDANALAFFSLMGYKSPEDILPQLVRFTNGDLGIMFASKLDPDCIIGITAAVPESGDIFTLTVFRQSMGNSTISDTYELEVDVTEDEERPLRLMAMIMVITESAKELLDDDDSIEIITTH